MKLHDLLASFKDSSGRNKIRRECWIKDEYIYFDIGMNCFKDEGGIHEEITCERILADDWVQCVPEKTQDEVDLEWLNEHAGVNSNNELGVVINMIKRKLFEEKK